jgi:ceramide glucosyltransferase
MGVLLLGFFALLSLGLTLWQAWVAFRFPLHQRRPPAFNPPAVTLLKPLKGCEPRTIECLRTWLVQDYRGTVQVLFGVASLADPVCDPVRRLLAEFPQLDAELVCCQQQLGVNAKVSTLIQLHRRAKHGLVLVSDADVLAPPDLLAQITTPFGEAGIGLVHCFYRLSHATTAAMRWEAVAINADFWSQVLQSQCLAAPDYALGAVMLTTQRYLDQIGGFEVMADFLADDYQLGHRIAQQGGAIVLSPVVVECRSVPMSWRQVWNHQLRWACTIRACKPMGHTLSILSNATLWPVLWLAFIPTRWVLMGACVCLLARLLVAVGLQHRLDRQPLAPVWWPLAWVKDLLQCVLWAASFLMNRVDWRGERYQILRGGKLRKLPS